MKNNFKKLKSYFKLPYIERYKVVMTMLLVLKSYFFVKFLPTSFYFHKYSFGTTKKTSDLQPFRHEISYIKRICQILPMEVTCLMESFVIQDSLKQHNFIAPISLGVMCNEDFKAHAWIVESNSQDYISLFTHD